MIKYSAYSAKRNQNIPTIPLPMIKNLKPTITIATISKQTNPKALQSISYKLHPALTINRKVKGRERKKRREKSKNKSSNLSLWKNLFSILTLKKTTTFSILKINKSNFSNKKTKKFNHKIKKK
jgi:hypothetical protein